MSNPSTSTQKLHFKEKFYVTIIFIITILGFTYLFIHHQTLKDLETKTNQPNISDETTLMAQRLELLEEKINNQTQSNPIINQEPNPHPDQTPTPFVPLNPETFLSFKDLIGLEDEKAALNSFMDFVKHQEHYQNMGKVDVSNGIIFYGVAGTGKTTLARALAKEANLAYFEVASSIFSRSVRGEAKDLVINLFDNARQEAETNGGAIIFLDECETIFTDLSKLDADSELNFVVNQFKTEMTSVHNNPLKPIFIIAATNHFHKLDEAIKSRFTHAIEIKPGNFEARKAFLNFLIHKRQNPYSDAAKTYLLEVINQYLDTLSTKDSYKKTNRTLENLVKTIILTTCQRHAKQVTIKDIKAAFKVVINNDLTPLIPLEQAFSTQHPTFINELKQT